MVVEFVLYFGVWSGSFWIEGFFGCFCGVVLCEDCLLGGYDLLVLCVFGVEWGVEVYECEGIGG